jgi:PadR family transcriptional regulator, regulatory protein PadR
MRAELLHGTLEVMVLKTLSWGPMHGFGIGRWLEEQGGEALKVEEGSLYPALYRLERKGWIDAEWGVSEKNRRAKYYRLTPQGRAALRATTNTWSEFARAVARVMNATQAPARS